MYFERLMPLARGTQVGMQEKPAQDSSAKMDLLTKAATEHIHRVLTEIEARQEKLAFFPTEEYLEQWQVKLDYTLSNDEEPRFLRYYNPCRTSIASKIMDDLVGQEDPLQRLYEDNRVGEFDSAREVAEYASDLLVTLQEDLRPGHKSRPHDYVLGHSVWHGIGYEQTIL